MPTDTEPGPSPVAPEPRQAEPRQAEPPQTVAFLLLDGFPLLAFAAALEPLRHANRLAERPLYAWRLLSPEGAPARASAGPALPVDGGPEDLAPGARLLVCAGDAAEDAPPRLTGWLRRQARAGVRLGAVGAGAWALARAGLLDGRRCTVHWEDRDRFAEAFPSVDVLEQLYVADRDLITAAGGAAAADLMLRLIADAHGPDLAAGVAEQMLLAGRREAGVRQRAGDPPSALGARHPVVARVTALMQERLADPLPAPALAEAVGLSTRQLERLFRRHLDVSPKRHYLTLRLERARRMLLQSPLPVAEISAACGFASPAHFSKCYRAHFKRTPYKERGEAVPAPRTPIPPAPAPELPAP